MTQNPMPLWPRGVPGLAELSTGDREAASEIPVLVPFLLADADTGSGARPLVLVCPGGGYARRADHEGEPVARWLNGLGLHAAVCHYRVAPWRHPQPLHDAQRALRLVRHQAAAWGVDAGRLGVLGFSAGGHLACTVANGGDDGQVEAVDPIERQSCRVQALIACYPVISSGPAAHRGSFANLLGGREDASLSLEHSVRASNPPSFIWHSADDPAVPVENALLYAQALRAQGVSFALHIYPHARHGVGLAQDQHGTVAGWTAEAAAWLGELGWR